MTEEEKEAIEFEEKEITRLQKIVNEAKYNNRFTAFYQDLQRKINNKEIILNLIQKQQEEIDFWKEDYNHRCQLAIDRKIELEKKDKIIDLMAKELENAKLAIFKREDGGEFLGKYRCYNKDDWKQYFEKKVEE